MGEVDEMNEREARRKTHLSTTRHESRSVLRNARLCRLSVVVEELDERAVALALVPVDVVVDPLLLPPVNVALRVGRGGGFGAHGDFLVLVYYQPGQEEG